MSELITILTESDPNHEWISYVPDYIDVSPFIAGVLAIGFIFGAYMAETFRVQFWRWNVGN